jgi:nitrogen fixation protein FixH
MPAKLLFTGRVLIALIMFLFFVVMVAVALTYPAQARFMPLVVGIPGIAFTLFELIKEVRLANSGDASAAPTGGDAGVVALPSDVSRLIGQETVDVPVETATFSPAELQRREWILLAYFTVLMITLIFFGFWIAVPVFITVFLREREKVSWPWALAGAALTLGVLYFVFYRGLGIDLHRGFITEWAWDLVFPPE